jgi:MFS family permease
MPSRLSRVAHTLADELGIRSFHNSPIDTKLLCLSRFVRLFAYGATTLILALYLSSLGISEARIGLFMTLTLLGDVAISFVLTVVADAVGRRRMLMLGAAMMVGSGVVFAVTGNYWGLVAASVVGVISPRWVIAANNSSRLMSSNRPSKSRANSL